MTMICPACGAPWADDSICQTHFHQMLFWEWEDPARLSVHHLMVLGYHLQHPHLYSPETLRDGMHMLVDFLENGVSPQQMRQQIGGKVDSGQRTNTITARPGHAGAYAHPVTWRMRAADVVAAGADAYIESVQQWARAILNDLRESGNLRGSETND
jgi:hypothetical protein